MNIKIKMLDVGDGDAIIIHLKRNKDEQLVILIDGGHGGDANAVIESLNELLEQAGKSGPDLIVCTHYDADHIGGLKRIAEKYGTEIGEVWIHQPGLQQAAMELARKVKESRIRPADFETYGEVASFKNQVLTEGLHEEAELVLESYGQMERLVTYLGEQGIKTIEPFNTTKLKGWPEIRVLGPTQEFYDSCYDKIAKPEALLLTEARTIKDENILLESKSSLKLAPFAERAVNPCEFLDSQKRDHVTEVNQVSVILQITVSNKKYLFTGDASLESFENIPSYPESLESIYFLKVAHHGSHNNSSSELFDIMKPKYAYISGGNRYLDDEVKNCLIKKGANVKTTRDDRELNFPE